MAILEYPPPLPGRGDLMTASDMDNTDRLRVSGGLCGADGEGQRGGGKLHLLQPRAAWQHRAGPHHPPRSEIKSLLPLKVTSWEKGALRVRIGMVRQNCAGSESYLILIGRKREYKFKKVY